MNEHDRLQAIKYIRYALAIIKENAVESDDYQSRNQEAILSAIGTIKAQVDALMEDASQVSQVARARATWKRTQPLWLISRFFLQ